MRERCARFEVTSIDLVEKLTNLAKEEVEFLLTKNREFITESKLFEEGGNYDKEEVAWYDGMMRELDE